MIDQSRFRTLMGRWATGVSVITSNSSRGPRGATANAVASLSLDPVLLLVCLDLSSNTLQALRESGRFGVNVLAATQEAHARRFAIKEPQDEKFAAVAHTFAQDVPVLDGCLAWLACDVEREVDGGDHAIVVGRPFDGDVAEGLDPLVFYRGAYGTLPR